MNIRVVCNGPLGMISGEIRDWQITASSTFWDPDCHEKNARLYQPADRAWCARHKSDSEWLQIDLGIAAKVRHLRFFSSLINDLLILQISGVLTQGRANKEEYVTSFMVSYSTDAYRWQYLVDRYGNQKVRYRVGDSSMDLLSFRYFPVIPIHIQFVIIISTKQSWHALSNFIQFNGILILRYG